MTFEPSPRMEPLHLRPNDYRILDADDVGAPGLVARESIGPSASVQALGPLVTVHDSTFDPGSGIGYHPHRRHERLCYVLEGGLEHDSEDDQHNDVQATMGTGDLAILTVGEGDVVHTERNHGGEPARAYVLAYPADAGPQSAMFDVVRDPTMPRAAPRDGVATKVVLGRDDERVHGEVYEIADTELGLGASLPVQLEAGEGALVFCLDGRLQVDVEQANPVEEVGLADTVVVPPASPERELRLVAQAPSRVLHVVTGEGAGLRMAAT